jgi:hypothetical protein
MGVLEVVGRDETPSNEGFQQAIDLAETDPESVREFTLGQRGGPFNLSKKP